MNPIVNTTSTASQLTNTSLADKYGINSNQAEAGKHSDKVSLSQTSHSSKVGSKEQVKDESVSLSPRAVRAQKIESMAKDFFADGNFSSTDLPKLVQRLYQDGILSETQLNRLSQGGIELPKSQDKVQDMKTFIQSKRNEFEKTSQDDKSMSNVLITLLDDAESVLDNMDSVQSKETSQEAARVSSQLNVYLQADVEMSAKDKDQWQGLKSLMQLASSMGDSQQAGGQLNSYLALGKY
ncbi:hypothetical protein HWQ46_10535 [Shewanella sp. D64]|uniref:hypothetical protein n=1 Tax=unclassified Shewanella TaxID=196818 RepID=UPI0022BA71E9|nr:MULTISPECIES: hypothetical protein [unclassified Shewanella]MEC4725983.1 hypothetical protein [Shewanella sp. D64]MEC4737238.1 hypothetical protein [Shewanella sp. E94]WBJ93617.1 hypothetical protein HWQ47_16985 [Shewanella sp. MTB7]